LLKRCANISPKYQPTFKKNDFIGVIFIREEKRLMKLPEKVGGIRQFFVKSLHFSILRHIGKFSAVHVIGRRRNYSLFIRCQGRHCRHLGIGGVIFLFTSSENR